MNPTSTADFDQRYQTHLKHLKLKGLHTHLTSHTNTLAKVLRAKLLAALGEEGLAPSYRHGESIYDSSITRCFACAPRTADRGMPWSSVTNRPRFLTASASK